MQKPSRNEYAAGYQKYFDLVPDGEYLNLLEQNSIETIGFFEEIPGEKLEYKYAPDKWTVKELLMHLIDTERVFLIADWSPPEAITLLKFTGWMKNCTREMLMSPAEPRQSLISEFKAVRGSTTQLFENVTDAQSKLQCNIITHPMTARAIGYFIIGHIKHHLNIIEERYL